MGWGGTFARKRVPGSWASADDFRCLAPAVEPGLGVLGSTAYTFKLDLTGDVCSCRPRLFLHVRRKETVSMFGLIACRKKAEA